MAFPKQFLWGVASSAYQVEGAALEGGRGLTVWDHFASQKGNIVDGHTGEVACDHYHRYEEDVELMRALGVRAYRLSVSWSRILPDGTGQPNRQGLDFYDRLVDCLLSNGIQPWITLFHWDFPLSLYYRGGWLNRESVNWFTDYAQVVVDRLSDRVQHWITLNEPQCYMGLGHWLRLHAPGVKLPLPELLRGIHHTLLAHGQSVQTIRAVARTKPVIGWSPVGCVCYPGSSHEEEVDAARRAMFSVPQTEQWVMNNTWYSDPVIRGHYPEDGLKQFGREMPLGFEGDMDLIAQPLDFYGVNIYHGAPVSLEVTVNEYNLPERQKRPPGSPRTLMNWTVDPEALYWGPRFLSERYGLPIYITENGLASMDWVHGDGKVHDPGRIDYLSRYLFQLQRALADGVDIRGYFHWSILDNFEWELGYTRRFGLAYVDFTRQERIPKDSYYWYRDVIRTNGANLIQNLATLR